MPVAKKAEDDKRTEKYTCSELSHVTLPKEELERQKKRGRNHILKSEEGGGGR